MFESTQFNFTNAKGFDMSCVLESPSSEDIASYALYAHCFSCSKQIAAAVRITRGLASRGIATVRFDFSGIGQSDGDISASTFSTNISEIEDVAAHMDEHYKAPSLLIGHSLGGAAALGAAGNIASLKAVATIGAPSDPEHVKHLFTNDIKRIIELGKAEVNLGGKTLTIGKDFIDDIARYDLPSKIETMKKPLLIMHSPTDSVVGIEHAQYIYETAKHPKSFISLDGADHMLTDKGDAEYAANLIATWSSKYVDTKDES